jgi:autotransporter family porin
MSLKNRLLAIVAVLALGITVMWAAHDEGTNAATSNGWTTTAAANSPQVARGGVVTVTVSVTASSAANALVDLEIYNGSTKAFQQFWDGQAFTPNVPRQFTATWTVPANEPMTAHVVKVGIFGAGWNGLPHWNDDAARVTVTAAGAPVTTATTATTTTTTTTIATTTTAKPTTTTTIATTTTAKPATSTTNGWTTAGAVNGPQVARGGVVTVTANVTAGSAINALVDLEIYNGSTKVFQRFWDGQAFTPNTPRQFTATWTVPANEPMSAHVVKIGVFGPGWLGLAHWNDDAARVTVTAAGGTPTTPTTQPATTTTAKPATTTTVAAPTTPAPTTPAPTLPPTGRFSTLPPGAALPSDATCAAQVRPMAERRQINNVPNHTKGTAVSGLARVTGDYVGTTDEIIQWVACKWGIDEDIVRAQISQESWWHQDARGDFTSNQNSCYPTVRTSSGQCPESVGLGQVRYQYHSLAFTNGYALSSSAFNLDYTYSVWRNCYEGRDTWLNTVERGATYGAGDLWGCVGVWFSGRWHTAPAETYISAVKGWLNQRVWETPNFQGG